MNLHVIPRWMKYLDNNAGSHCEITKEWAGKAKSGKLEFLVTIRGYLMEKGGKPIRSVAVVISNWNFISTL